MGGRRLRIALGSLAAVLVAAAVAFWLVRPDVAPEGPVAVPTTSASPPSTAVLAPLTGEPVADRSRLDHPAVAVKVSNVRSAHPQVGVDRADIVFCEPIGVSYTRLAAVFHSDIPNQVGPVRSARPMDAPILGPLDPVFGHTMAAGWVMSYLRSVGSTESLGSLQVPRRAGAYAIDRSRPSPDDVMVSPPTLLERSRTATTPRPYFAFAEDASGASAAGGARASRVTIAYGPGWTVRWMFDAATGRYLRDEAWGPHVSADGVQIHATNVLILDAESVTEKLAPGTGSPVPVVQLIDASGPLLALTAGGAVHGTWSKGAVDEPFVLRTGTGEPLLLAPGNTWVELPAPGAGVAYS